MSRRHRSKKSAFALVALVLLTVLVGCGLTVRWRMREAAIGYGLELQSALYDRQDPQTVGQPRGQRDIFNEPKMLEFDRTLRSPWGIVGVDYLERAEELRLGIVYLHTQLAEPSALRFAHTPKLAHFSLEPGDKGDAAVQRAIRTLMEDYLTSVGSR